MRRIGERSLWICNSGDLGDPRGILSEGIEAVVELADSEPLALLPRDLVRCRFPLSDGGENPHWLIRLAIQTVADLLRASVPTAVACNYGMNRSVCIASGALALAEGVTLHDALLTITSTGSADVSPGLWAQISGAITNQE